MAKGIYRIGFVITVLYCLLSGYGVYSRLFESNKPEYYDLVVTISVFVAFVYFLIFIWLLRTLKIRVSYLAGIGFIFFWLAYKVPATLARLDIDINPSESIKTFLNYSYPSSFIIFGIIIAITATSNNRLLRIYGIMTSLFYVMLFVIKEFNLRGEPQVAAIKLSLFAIMIVIYTHEIRKLNVVESDVLDNEREHTIQKNENTTQ